MRALEAAAACKKSHVGALGLNQLSLSLVASLFERFDGRKSVEPSTLSRSLPRAKHSTQAGRYIIEVSYDNTILADAREHRESTHLRAAPRRRERLLLLSGEGRVDEHGVRIRCRDAARHLGGLAAAEQELRVHAAQRYHLHVEAGRPSGKGVLARGGKPYL